MTVATKVKKEVKEKVDKSDTVSRTNEINSLILNLVVDNTALILKLENARRTINDKDFETRLKEIDLNNEKILNLITKREQEKK